jgi:hypothetical protein
MRLPMFVIASLLAAGTPTLLADSFTAYSNPSHPITTSSPVIYNGANGVGITAYFFSVSAADTDTISVYDATKGVFLQPEGALNNQVSVAGTTTVVFTNTDPLHELTTGDVLYFDLYNTSYPTDTFSSNTLTSPDSDNHAYITPFNGPIGAFGNIVGTYVGMEDLPAGSSDWDYNDDTFVFTSVTDPAPTPEPSSFALLGTGLLGVARFVRRRFVR